MADEASGAGSAGVAIPLRQEAETVVWQDSGSMVAEEPGTALLQAGPTAPAISSRALALSRSRV